MALNNCNGLDVSLINIVFICFTLTYVFKLIVNKIKKKKTVVAVCAGGCEFHRLQSRSYTNDKKKILSNWDSIPSPLYPTEHKER